MVGADVVVGALGAAVVPVGVVELAPEGEDAVAAAAAGVVCAVGSLGVIERVMAWTLCVCGS